MSESLESELAVIASKFIDFSPNHFCVDRDLIEQSFEWQKLQSEHMKACGILASIDAGSMERGRIIYLNMMLAQKELMSAPLFYTTENGVIKEHPAGSALRSWVGLMERWEGQHAAYPLARKHINLSLDEVSQPKAPHGNSKKSKVLDLINGD